MTLQHQANYTIIRTKWLTIILILVFHLNRNDDRLLFIKLVNVGNPSSANVCNTVATSITEKYFNTLIVT